MKEKYLKIFIIVFTLLFFGFVFSFLGGSNEGAKNIKIEGNRVTMILNGKKVIAELKEKSKEIFLVDSGDSKSNVGEFYVVTKDKLQYLEQNYPDFMNCPSLDADEYKNSLIYVGFIAANKTAETELKVAANLFHKGVAKITGSKLNIPGKKEIPDMGFMNLIGKKPGVYYLIDKIEVIDTQYQKGKNY